MLVDEWKEIDFEDWADEEEVSLGGGRYMGIGKLFGLVCFESRRMSFAIPNGIVIYGYIVEENSCDSCWVVEWIELEGDFRLVVVKALSSLDKLQMIFLGSEESLFDDMQYELDESDLFSIDLWSFSW